MTLVFYFNTLWISSSKLDSIGLIKNNFSIIKLVKRFIKLVIVLEISASKSYLSQSEYMESHLCLRFQL